MNTVTDVLRDMIFGALNTAYGGVIFDTAGLARMLFPCLLLLAAALVVYLLLKCFYDIRRFAHVVIAAALIVLIAFSTFFPGTLQSMGDYASNWIQQRVESPAEQPSSLPQEGLT